MISGFPILRTTRTIPFLPLELCAGLAVVGNMVKSTSFARVLGDILLLRINEDAVYAFFLLLSLSCSVVLKKTFEEIKTKQK
jgi:hypothetical protein